MNINELSELAGPGLIEEMLTGLSDEEIKSLIVDSNLQSAKIYICIDSSNPFMGGNIIVSDTIPQTKPYLDVDSSNLQRQLFS